MLRCPHSAQFRVIAVDSLGYGDSDTVDRGLDVDVAGAVGCHPRRSRSGRTTRLMTGPETGIGPSPGQ